MSKRMATEVNIVQKGNALESGILEWGKPSLYACPECHGVLLQLKAGSNLRFRCRTGHAHSRESRLAEFAERTEEAGWSALRSREAIVLRRRRMPMHPPEHPHDGAAEALRKKAQEAYRRVELVRQTVTGQEKLSKR